MSQPTSPQPTGGPVPGSGVPVRQRAEQLLRDHLAPVRRLASTPPPSRSGSGIGGTGLWAGVVAVPYASQPFDTVDTVHTGDAGDATRGIPEGWDVERVWRNSRARLPLLIPQASPQMLGHARPSTPSPGCWVFEDPDRTRRTVLFEDGTVAVASTFPAWPQNYQPALGASSNPATITALSDVADVGEVADWGGAAVDDAVGSHQLECFIDRAVAVVVLHHRQHAITVPVHLVLRLAWSSPTGRVHHIEYGDENRWPVPYRPNPHALRTWHDITADFQPDSPVSHRRAALHLATHALQQAGLGPPQWLPSS